MKRTDDWQNAAPVLFTIRFIVFFGRYHTFYTFGLYSLK